MELWPGNNEKDSDFKEMRHDACVMSIKDASNIKFSILGFIPLSYHWFWWKLDLSKWNNKKGRVILRKCVMTHASCQFWRILSHFWFSHTSRVDSPYSKTPVYQVSLIYNWNYIPPAIFKDIWKYVLSIKEKRHCCVILFYPLKHS